MMGGIFQNMRQHNQGLEYNSQLQSTDMVQVRHDISSSSWHCLANLLQSEQVLVSVNKMQKSQ